MLEKGRSKSIVHLSQWHDSFTCHRPTKHYTWQYLKKKYLLKYNKMDSEIYPKSLPLSWTKPLNPFFSFWTKPPKSLILSWTEPNPQIPSSLLNQTPNTFFSLEPNPNSKNPYFFTPAIREGSLHWKQREVAQAERSFPRYECNGFMSLFGFLLLLVEIGSSISHFCNYQFSTWDQGLKSRKISAIFRSNIAYWLTPTQYSSPIIDRQKFG